MKKLPIGKQEFRQLIEGDFIYVDKTKPLTLMGENTVPIFLSRPRRFGKSLTVSTFSELFSGNKGLFKNTYAYENWDFTQIFPVIHFDLSTLFGESFLTQAGYLTIKEHKDHKYTLDFPNYEVRRSFSDLLVTSQYDVKDSDILGVEENLKEAFEKEDPEEIISQFKIIYSSIPYMHFDSNKNEHFYSATLLMFLQATGFDASPERIGNKGRLDLSIKYGNCIYIIELKNDKPTVAIQQIHKKNYGGKYKNRKVINIGLQIDFKERNIIDFLVEPHQTKIRKK